MEITDELRRAVRMENCAWQGHEFDLANVVRNSEVPSPNDPRGIPIHVLGARDVGKMPHIVCSRCDTVWLVIDEPGRDYEDAVTKVAERLEDLTPDNTEPLHPGEVTGVAGVPIPMAPGAVWEDLPQDHPAMVHEEIHKRALIEHDHAEETS